MPEINMEFIELVLKDGKHISIGYLPDSNPKRYMEIWAYLGYTYIVITEPTTMHRIGLHY